MKSETIICFIDLGGFLQMPNYKITPVPLARLSFVETCGPYWQRAKFGRNPRKQLQVLPYGRTNSSSLSASGLCHLHGLRNRHDECFKILTGLGQGSVDAEHNSMILLSAVNVNTPSLSSYVSLICFCALMINTLYFED